MAFRMFSYSNNAIFFFALEVVTILAFRLQIRSKWKKAMYKVK